MDVFHRSSGTPVGFGECIQSETFDAHNEGRLSLKLNKFVLSTTQEIKEEIKKDKAEKAASK